MKPTSKLIPMILLFSFFGLFSQNKKATESNSQKNELESGQIWKYKTRSTEEDSRIIILKIENINGEDIVHIAIDNLNIKNPHSPDGKSKEIGHSPMSKKAFLNSITKLVSADNSVPDFEEGYNLWKEAFESGEGGIFTVSIKEVVDFIEETMN